MNRLQSVVGGKWKRLILWYIAFYKKIPPKVEYSLTELGESFIPVLETMVAANRI